MARSAPIAFTSRTVPPELGMMPISTSGSPNIAAESAIRKSHASASSNPPPRHHPRIAAMVGCGSRAIRS